MAVILSITLLLAEAEELTQSFFAEVVLKRELFERAEAERGRLRSLILRSLSNFLADQIRRRGVGERVCLEGAADPSQVRAALARARIFALPCQGADRDDHDGLPVAILEAMAMGLPVVGTTSATQGIEGTPGEDFLLADDADGIARAVCGLLADRERARALGRRGRAFVEEKYAWDVCLRPLDELLDELGRDQGERNE